MVAYRILGSLEVAEDGRLANLGPPKQRVLLAILLLNANEIVPIDRIIDLLWGDRPPRQAAHAVQVYVSELRRALEPLAGMDVIAWRSPGYLLRIDPDALDANLVERLVTDGAHAVDTGDLAAADTVLGRARELWRGPPLSDFAYEEFAQDDTSRRPATPVSRSRRSDPSASAATSSEAPPTSRMATTSRGRIRSASSTWRTRIAQQWVIWDELE